MKSETEKIVEVPQGIGLKLSGSDLELSAGGKSVKSAFKINGVGMEIRGNSVVLKSALGAKKTKKFLNLIESKIKNMVTGLQKGYEYRLEVIYSHFPMNIAVKQGAVEINNIMGAKHPKIAKIVGETAVAVKGKEITVAGNNKEHVGQTAANLEQATRVKGRDIRRFQDGIYIVNKTVKG